MLVMTVSGMFFNPLDCAAVNRLLQPLALSLTLRTKPSFDHGRETGI